MRVVEWGCVGGCARWSSCSPRTLSVVPCRLRSPSSCSPPSLFHSPCATSSLSLSFRKWPRCCHLVVALVLVSQQCEHVFCDARGKREFESAKHRQCVFLVLLFASFVCFDVWTLTSVLRLCVCCRPFRVWDATTVLLRSVVQREVVCLSRVSVVVEACLAAVLV